MAELSLAGQLTAESVLLSATLYLSLKKEVVVNELGHVDPQDFLLPGFGPKTKRENTTVLLGMPQIFPESCLFSKTMREEAKISLYQWEKN